MPVRRPALLPELLVVLLLLVGYDRVAGLAAVRASAAVSHGLDLLALERRLGVDVELALDHAVAGHRLLGQVMSLYYDLVHAAATMLVLLGVWLCAPAAYRHARRALVAVNVAALAVFAVLPVAPPRLLPGAGFVDVVARSGTWGAWYSTSAASAHADAYASVPSLHVAWALWVVLAVRATTRRGGPRALAAAHLATTVVVVVATGNHYLFDVLSGVALTATAWAATTTPALRALLRLAAPADRSVPGRGAAS